MVGVGDQAHGGGMRQHVLHLAHDAVAIDEGVVARDPRQRVLGRCGADSVPRAR